MKYIKVEANNWDIISVKEILKNKGRIMAQDRVDNDPIPDWVYRLSWNEEFFFSRETCKDIPENSIIIKKSDIILREDSYLAYNLRSWGYTKDIFLGISKERFEKEFKPREELSLEWIMDRVVDQLNEDKGERRITFISDGLNFER